MCNTFHLKSCEHPCSPCVYTTGMHSTSRTIELASHPGFSPLTAGSVSKPTPDSSLTEHGSSTSPASITPLPSSSQGVQEGSFLPAAASVTAFSTGRLTLCACVLAHCDIHPRLTTWKERALFGLTFHRLQTLPSLGQQVECDSQELTVKRIMIITSRWTRRKERGGGRDWCGKTAGTKRLFLPLGSIYFPLANSIAAAARDPASACNFDGHCSSATHPSLSTPQLPPLLPIFPFPLEPSTLPSCPP